MRKGKKVGLLVLLLGIVAIPFVKVSAAEERYTSSIEIQSASTLTGATRDYEYNKHKISIRPTSLTFNRNDTNNVPVVLVDITLQKKGLLGGYSNKADGTLSMYNTSTTYTLYMGNVGSGKYRYHFYTGTMAHMYGGFTANPVYMYSYE